MILEGFRAAKLPEFLAALCADGEAPGEMLDLLLNSWPDSVMMFDAAGQLLFANRRAVAELDGRRLAVSESLRELQTAIRLFDAATDEPVPRDRGPITRALKGETVEAGEYLARAERTGQTAWLECRAMPVTGRDGRIRGALLTARDISSSKRREFELRSSYQLSDFVYQGNLAGILHAAVDGRILDCNDAMVRMLGYSSCDELKGIRMDQLYFDPEDRGRMLRLVKSSGRLSEYEVCLRRRDGARLWGIANICLIKPLPDRVGGELITAVVDITERKIWEETVRQSEQRFTAFMHYLPGIAFIKDLHGRYVYYNEASWRLFGKRPDEIVGKTDEMIWPAEDARIYRENDARVIETGRPVEAVEPVEHADGEHSWLISKFPIHENGESALVGGIGVDITARLALESRLTEAGKMEALGRLAGGVAHDFNNLLTVISGYGQLAIESLGSAPPERIAMYVQEILTSARRAASLTGQLLAFSRRQSLQPQVMDVCDLMRKMERLLQRMIGEHVELTVGCLSHPCLIHADPQQIEQVLLNLSVNARDAMPLGGRLEIECRVLDEAVVKQGTGPLEVLIEVRDNGIGMEEPVKARIFEPFFTSKDKAKGTGLGLSTVYGIVTQAGGAIEVESELGEGTTFSVYFPRANAEPERETPGQTVEEKKGETVLLVEDDAAVRSLVEAILHKLGFRALVADSGEAALEIWNRSWAEIDVLLTDVVMPHMSGSDLAKKLREFDPSLKVLFMSGYTDDMIEGHGVLGSETQLIVKPFTSEQLARRIRAVLDS